MADLRGNNGVHLQAVNNGYNDANQGLNNLELEPSREYRHDELLEMGSYLNSSRQWMGDLEVRKRRLTMLLKAQERMYSCLKERERQEIDHLARITEAGEAGRRLMNGLYKPEEKDGLIIKLRGTPEFEDVYKKFLRKEKEQDIMDRIVEFQRKQIEELKAQHSKLNEELQQVKARTSWKRIFLSLFCAKTEEE